MLKGGLKKQDGLLCVAVEGLSGGTELEPKVKLASDVFESILSSEVGSQLNRNLADLVAAVVRTDEELTYTPEKRDRLVVEPECVEDLTLYPQSIDMIDLLRETVQPGWTQAVTDSEKCLVGSVRLTAGEMDD